MMLMSVCIYIYSRQKGALTELLAPEPAAPPPAAAPPLLNWQALSATGTFLGAAGAVSCFLEEAEEEEVGGSLATIRDAVGGINEEVEEAGGGARVDDATEAIFGSNADA